MTVAMIGTIQWKKKSPRKNQLKRKNTKAWEFFPMWCNELDAKSRQSSWFSNVLFHKCRDWTINYRQFSVRKASASSPNIQKCNNIDEVGGCVLTFQAPLEPTGLNRECWTETRFSSRNSVGYFSRRCNWLVNRKLFYLYYIARAARA